MSVGLASSYAAHSPVLAPRAGGDLGHHGTPATLVGESAPASAPSSAYSTLQAARAATNAAAGEEDGGGGGGSSANGRGGHSAMNGASAAGDSLEPTPKRGVYRHDESDPGSAAICAATPSDGVSDGSLFAGRGSVGKHAALSSLEQSQKQLEQKLAALRAKIDM